MKPYPIDSFSQDISVFMLKNLEALPESYVSIFCYIKIQD